MHGSIEPSGLVAFGFLNDSSLSCIGVLSCLSCLVVRQYLLSYEWLSIAWCTALLDCQWRNIHGFLDPNGFDVSGFWIIRHWVGLVPSIDFELFGFAICIAVNDGQWFAWSMCMCCLCWSQVALILVFKLVILVAMGRFVGTKIKWLLTELFKIRVPVYEYCKGLWW